MLGINYISYGGRSTSRRVGIILWCIPSMMMGCQQSELKSEGDVGSAQSAVLINDQRANTFPTGTSFRGTGLRYVAYTGTNNHFVNVVSSPPPDSGLAVWSPPQIFSDDQANGDGAVSITEFNGKLYY